MTTGFKWGMNNTPLTNNTTTNVTSTTAETSSSLTNNTPRSTPDESTALITKPSIKKRRYHNDNNNNTIITSESDIPGRKYYPPPPPSKFKRSRTPRIIGQPLPTNRLIEVLDKHSLQSLLTNLIQYHPEIQNTIHKLSPKPTLISSIELIKEKFDDILNHLPYKCDIESDYSYLRIKPHLQEFLECLSDFILSFLPPIELNIITSLTFLHEITNLLHNLPNFSNNEFQYTRSMAYEQIANTWLIVVSSQQQQRDDKEDSPSTSSGTTEDCKQIITIIHEYDLLDKLAKHNEISRNKFIKVIDYLKSELEQDELINHATSNNPLSDMITVDYSNYSIIARTSH